MSSYCPPLAHRLSALFINRRMPPRLTPPHVVSPVVEKVSGLFFALFNCSARRAAAKNSTDEFAFGGSAGGSDAGQPFHSLGWNNPAWASPGASSIHGDGSQVSSTPGGLSTPGAVPTPKIPLEDPNASPTVNRRMYVAVACHLAFFCAACACRNVSLTTYLPHYLFGPLVCFPQRISRTDP